MSTRGKRIGLNILLIAGIGAFVGTLHWVTDPDVLRAKPDTEENPVCEAGNCNGNGPPPPPPPPPVVDPEFSIVFVIDSSLSMFPRYGKDYFELAKEGIAAFLDLPGFPTNGRIEASVIQFTSLEAPEYLDHVHWISPGQITSAGTRNFVSHLVRGLERSMHHTASLMEIGIREATYLLDEVFPIPPRPTGRHIILLTTGEYRLPSPCPPECYGLPPDDDCWTSGDCADDQSGCFNGELCNRACRIRDFARVARQKNITISALRVGPDWKNDLRFAGDCAEPENPYEYAQDHCSGALPDQPDRAGFLMELANTGGCDDQLIGKTARINPFLPSGCASDECRPGKPRDIALALARWFDEWYENDPDTDADTDADSVGNFSDNCPNEYNPQQRDCDLNGLGDACQWTASSCGTGTLDSDCDGVPNWVDVCPGGDDCLVTIWLDQLECDDAADPDHCACDCDHDGSTDACQAAQAMRATTLPDPDASPPTEWADIDGDMDGIADSCDGNPGLTCQPIPPVCVPDNTQDHDYLEDFSAIFGDAPFDGPAELLDDGLRYGVAEDGWWVVGSHAAVGDAVTLEPETADNALAIGLDDSVGIPVDGSYSWFVEGPGLQVPLEGCRPTVCDHGAFRGVPGNHENDPNAWSVLAVEMDLYIDNDHNGPNYDLYVLDPCVDDLEDAKRVHLRFRDHPDPGNPDGLIEYELPSYWNYGDDTPDDDTAYAGSAVYPMGSWFSLKLVINSNRLYQYTQALGCHYVGDRETVYVYKKVPPTSPDSEYDDAFHHRLEELGRTVPEQARGVQLQFVTNNKQHDGTTGADILQIDNVRLRRVEPCEWQWGASCAIRETDEDSWCACGWESGHNRWHCSTAPCGDGDVSVESGEECDPPDYEHCNTDCHWICGDGVVQSSAPDEASKCNGSLIHCDGATCLQGCGPGSEECERPGHLFGDDDEDGVYDHYCDLHCREYFIDIDTCTAICGNDIVEDHLPFCDPEECDDGNNEPGDGCDESCNCEEGSLLPECESDDYGE